MVKRAAYNTGLAKVAVQCSEATFVDNQTLVLRINICAANRHLRQARKRCAQFNRIMQSSGRIIIDIKGKKSFFLWNGTESYYKKLRKAFTDIVNGQDSEYLYFGFCTLCASTLEYSLNYILVDYCIDKFGPENYMRYCEEYIGIPFRKKLIMIPHIVSEGKYMLNEANPSFQYLGELITLRNKILHNKDFLKEYDIPITKDNEDSISSFTQEKTELKLELDLQTTSNYIDTITKENCINFGNALGEFKKFIMIPALNNDLKENIMINKITW